MRIHQLRFGALGPYAGEHQIDFDALGGSALFIIDGPTGAGKSTILDALVFALYADVSGSSSDKQRLRSAFADPNSESFAEVEFSTSAGRYKVRRTPEYERPKIKGGGMTMVPPTTIIWRSTGEHAWEPISRRHREADLEIVRAVGLDKHQFQQTVVLPQGEFATFLKAKSTDRQSILERIFATSLYSQIQEQCDEQRRTAERDRQVSQGKVRDAAQKLMGRLTGPAAAHLAFAEEVSKVESVIGEASASVAAVVALIQNSHRQAATHAAVLAEAAQARMAQQEGVFARVSQARALDLAVQEASDQLAGAIEAQGLAIANLAEHSNVIDTANAELEPDRAIQNVDEAIGSLADLAQRAAQLPALKIKIDKSTKSLGELRGQVAKLHDERAAEIPARLQEIAAYLRGERDRVDEAITVSGNYQAALFDQRLSGIAAELAGHLVAGSPCSVCGALVHLSPAVSVVAPVSERDLARAKSELASHTEARLLVERQMSLAQAAMASTSFADAHSPAVREVEVQDIDSILHSLQQRLVEVTRALAETQIREAELLTSIQEQVVVYQRGLTEIEVALGVGADIAGRIGELTTARASIELVRGTRADVSGARQLYERAVTAMAAANVEVDEVIFAQTEQELADAKSDEQRLHGVYVQLRDLADAVDDLGAEFVAAAHDVDDLNERIGPIIRIAEVLNGRGANSLLQPLKAYVVQQMFVEVIAAANVRLSGMLAGRFALVDTEHATGRERSLGLGLEVADLVTETNRRTETLSGGETFCASLALALGLADTVKSHAGGVDIGVLFVDEGFGALDQDRLDDVMAELLKLRVDGRTVGVISHVSEMKKSILERITVVPLGADKGSTLGVSWMP